MKRLVVCSAVLFVVAGCSSSASRDKDSVAGVGLANPAAEYCTAQGGKFEVRPSDGGEAGFCVVNGKAWEAWSFFRGEVGPGIEPVVVQLALAGQMKTIRPCKAWSRPERVAQPVKELAANESVVVKKAVRYKNVVWTQVEISLGSYTVLGWLEGDPQAVVRK